MNYLGIDYGRKRIGLARSIGWMAEPMMIIHNSEETIRQIAEICDEYGIEELVFGLSEGEMAEETKVFAKEVSEEVQLPIHYIDETMSSKEVAQLVRAAGKKMKDRQAPIDHYAAAHILQLFLDTQK
jgi:putative Holliday junction resolvase